jgi:hypothetical protein
LTRKAGANRNVEVRGLQGGRAIPQIRCECKRLLSYPTELAGKLVRCPGCSAAIWLPEAPPAPAGKPAPPPAPHQGGELRLESQEADIPLAARVPTRERAAPPDSPPPPHPPPIGTEGRRPPPATPKPGAAAQDYWRSLPGAFRFPLTADGAVALIVGAIFLTVAHYLMILAAVSLVGIVLSGLIDIVGTGYVAGYLMTIIERTAHGQDDAPDWPDLTDWHETVLKPFGFLLGLCILGLGPYLAYRYLAHEPDMAVAGAILAAGLFYMPLGMLCVALANDYTGLNPVRVIRAICSVPARYFAAWVLVACCAAAEIWGSAWIAAIPIPVVGTLLQQAVSCYFLFVAVRILGLLYYKSGRQLNWLAGRASGMGANEVHE